jgi:hypothetical protein
MKFGWNGSEQAKPRETRMKDTIAKKTGLRLAASRRTNLSGESRDDGFSSSL